MATKQEVKIPDIGGASAVEVIEVLVKKGDEISQEMPLVTLESDKASMEIPSPTSGTVSEVHLKVGDKVSAGDLILVLSQAAAPKNTVAEQPEEKQSSHTVNVEETTAEQQSAVASPDHTHEALSAGETNDEVIDSAEEDARFAAGPAARRLAREVGISLIDVQGTGRKSRISREDVQAFIKAKLQGKSNTSLGLPPLAAVDFSKFGAIDTKPLSKIKRLTGVNVHRAWMTIPHVTQFDEADITELEAFRKMEIATTRDASVKLTLLAFVCKIVSKALAIFPQFNASLDVSGENLIYKKYYNIGVAVETPQGLVVPVIKGVDQLSVKEVAQQMAQLSHQAREKGLALSDMQGGCFTISSLGGIGGTAFTPIVNSPEVAILGLSKATIKPMYADGEFKPRLMLPLSLSYDHRVIDGAEAARFICFLSEQLNDIRRIIL